MERDRSKGALARLHRSGKLELLFEFTADGAGVVLEDLATLPAEYVINGNSHSLGLRTCRGLWRCLFDDNGREIAEREQDDRLRKYLWKISAQRGIRLRETTQAQPLRHPRRDEHVRSQASDSAARRRDMHARLKEKNAAPVH